MPFIVICVCFLWDTELYNSEVVREFVLSEWVNILFSFFLRSNYCVFWSVFCLFCNDLVALLMLSINLGFVSEIV